MGMTTGRRLLGGLLAAVLTGLFTVTLPAAPARAEFTQSVTWPENWGSPFNTTFVDVMTAYAAFSKGCPDANLSHRYTYFEEVGDRENLGVRLLWAEGRQVYAIADGVVRSVDKPWGDGAREVVVIQHTAFPDERFIAAYGHVWAVNNPATNTKWKAGDEVHRGDVIATVAAPEGGPAFLHFGIELGDGSAVEEGVNAACVHIPLDTVDPLPFLAARGPTTGTNSVLGAGYLRTPDGTHYRLVGGAPIKVTDCDALGGCVPLRDVPSINGYRQTVADNTFVRIADGELAGRVTRAAGGTLIPVSSCDELDGCPAWTDINGPSYTAYLNDNPTMEDGTLVRIIDGDKEGLVGRAVGGALLDLSSCAPFNGCGRAVEINEASYEDYADAHEDIEDETFVRAVDGDIAGRVGRAVGSMLFDLPNCDLFASCPGTIEVNGSTYKEYVEQHREMTDGTFVKILDGESAGTVARAAGETLLKLEDCDVFDDCKDAVGITQEAYTKYAEAHPLMENGAYLSVADGDNAGQTGIAVGGALVPLVDCAGLTGCDQAVKVNSETYFAYLDAHEKITNGYFVRVIDGDTPGLRARAAGGTLIALSSCSPFSGCPDTVAVNAASYSAYLNENPAMDDGTFVVVEDGDDEGMVGLSVAETLIEVENCEALGGCPNPVGINFSSWGQYQDTHKTLKDETIIEGRPSANRWEVDEGCLDGVGDDAGSSDVVVPDDAVDDLRALTKECESSLAGVTSALPLVFGAFVLVGGAVLFVRRKPAGAGVPKGSTPVRVPKTDRPVRPKVAMPKVTIPKVPMPKMPAPKPAGAGVGAAVPAGAGVGAGAGKPVGAPTVLGTGGASPITGVPAGGGAGAAPGSTGGGKAGKGGGFLGRSPKASKSPKPGRAAKPPKPPKPPKPGRLNKPAAVPKAATTGKPMKPAGLAGGLSKFLKPKKKGAAGAAAAGTAVAGTGVAPSVAGGLGTAPVAPPPPTPAPGVDTPIDFSAPTAAPPPPAPVPTGPPVATAAPAPTATPAPTAAPAPAPAPAPVAPAPAPVAPAPAPAPAPVAPAPVAPAPAPAPVAPAPAPAPAPVAPAPVAPAPAPAPAPVAPAPVAPAPTAPAAPPPAPSPPEGPASRFTTPSPGDED